MDPEPALYGADSMNVSGASAAHAAEGTCSFNATWHAGDAALLQPDNLSIARVQRAWERKPLEPFSRQRLRVGKVWKRHAPSRHYPAFDAPTINDRASKRQKARTSPLGPLKPVKKMCLDSTFGMAPRVLQWERVESPMRKIVTRSIADEEDLLALPDAEECESSGDNRDVTVEILDEDGTLLDVGGEELVKHADWEYEDDTANFASEQAHRNIAPADTTNIDVLLPSATISISEVNFNIVGDEPAASSQLFTDGTDGIAATGDTTMLDSLHAASHQSAASPPLISSRLPHGFVSPMKKCQTPLAKSTSTSTKSRRRRTLPVEFAPIPGCDTISSGDLTAPEPLPSNDEDDASSLASSSMATNVNNDQPELDPEDDSELEWEDVEDDPAPQHEYGDEHIQSFMDYERAVLANDPSAAVNASQHRYSISAHISADNNARAANATPSSLHTDSKLPSGPIPSIGRQHPRLSLRRSPRRKSSSPLKQSMIPSTGGSHLIALTPIRGPAPHSSQSIHPFQSPPLIQKDIVISSNLTPAIERAASAPPEQPRMSPQKPVRPRVSDDTALLQAFLNRAAESRTSQRVSASKRESFTNRRDSDTVRQALASPGKTDVLVDLDPNSPSPRKPLASLGKAGVFDSIELGASPLPDGTDDLQEGLSTRRSCRAARRNQPQTSSVAPNKIAIRGNTEHTILQKSEAQQLAVTTKNNTRKNKGGAILPPLRLKKLASQTSSTEAEVEVEDASSRAAEKTRTIRNVTWSERLVEFYQGSELSEVSVLSDELNAVPQLEHRVPAEGDSVPQAPPASETPSKPKTRRLKPSRTAMAASNAPINMASPPPAGDKLATTEPELNPLNRLVVPSTKRRSRIATPAKGLTSSSLLPSNLDVAEEHAAAVAEQKGLPKRKAPISKLPALSTTSASVGQGKENLASSPPKKRAGGPPSAKTFAPKLDFDNKTQLHPDESVYLPGLTSPAKKGKVKGVLFLGNAVAPDFPGNKREEMPGLSSPAKKRTRRAGGAH